VVREDQLNGKIGEVKPKNKRPVRQIRICRKQLNLRHRIITEQKQIIKNKENNNASTSLRPLHKLLAPGDQEGLQLFLELNRVMFVPNIIWKKIPHLWGRM